ncbi:MAG: hypothetical protein V4574_06485 [Pseudomonadota bacterium]
MTKPKLFAAAAALALLAGCGEQEAAPVNIVTTVDTGSDANVVVPAANDAAAVVVNEAAAVPALNLAPDGLSLVTASGSSRHASFGMGRDVAVPMISAALGKPTDTGRNDECGQGPMETVAFTGGLTLFFQEGKFVGWDLGDKSALATAAGIGIGSTLRQVREAMTVTVEESTLGHEFSAGDLGGLLSAAAPDGKVEHLWAGSTCQFR